MEFNCDALHVMNDNWALVTAGEEGNFNTMTVSWGGMGTIWNKPTVTIYIRTSRYTLEFLDKNEYFTMSFFDESYKAGALTVLGRKSGRDCDKVAESGLTPVAVSHGVSFKEANRTLICKKMFRQELATENMLPEIAEKNYTPTSGGNHIMFLAEVVEVIE